MSDVRSPKFGVCDRCLKFPCQCSQPTPSPLTRHDYRECPMCAANRPRFCAQYYETENAVLIEQVKAAITDNLTPGGVKATYEQLLDINAAQRRTIEQQAQEVEKQNGKLMELGYAHGNALIEIHDLKQQLAASQARARELEEIINKADYRHIMDPPDGGDPTVVEKAQHLVDRLTHANHSIAHLQATLASYADTAERARTLESHIRETCEVELNAL